MIVIVTIVIVTHMLPTCVGHPQNPLLTHPHSLLFAFIVVVQSIGRSSAETILEITERRVAYPVQHPVGTQPPQCPTQGKPNNQSNFPYRDYRYSDQPRQIRFNEKQNQMYSPHHSAPSPALSAGSNLLSHSIMQLAETQSHSLEIFAAQQKPQIEVYQELTRSNKEKEHDALFISIPVFDGDHNQCEQWLDDMDQATRISG